MSQDTKTPTMPGLGTNWLETMTAMGNEMMAFTSDRITQDLETQQALLGAKGLDEVQQIQMAFFQKAMQDYSTEIGKLMQVKATSDAQSETEHSTPV